MIDTVKNIWMDGRLVPWKKAQVHVLTHGLHYGSGVFEGIRFYKTGRGPAVFRLHEHVRRFFYSAKCMYMKIQYSEQEIADAVLQTVRSNKLSSGYIRPICFYKYGKMGLYPADLGINVVIAAWPWGKYIDDKFVRVKISSFVRAHPQSTVVDAKLCGNYVNSILACEEAKQEGYTEALFVDYRGNVAEGPGENFFIVEEGLLKTPPKADILPGITRDAIIKIACNLGYEVDEVHLLPEDAKTADEAFFCGTAAEITPIHQIDNRVISNGKTGKITGKLRSKFRNIVHGKDSTYNEWLTYI